MQLVWAENVVRHTNRPVLILTPLAVGAQTVREAAKVLVDRKLLVVEARAEAGAQAKSRYVRLADKAAAIMADFRATVPA